MWKIPTIALLFFLFVSLFTACNHSKKENILSQGKSNFDGKGFGLSLRTDKAIYKEGEPIEIELKIFNYSKDTVTFSFRNSQRYDFIIENDEGEKIWQWSQERMFAMVTGEEILGPENPEIVYRENYNGKLKSGNYKITGIFTSIERIMLGNLIITVK